MELVLVLPVFLVLLFAIIEFSLLSSAQNRLSEAARTGVRQLCISNKSPEDIRQSVHDQLGPKLSDGVRVDVIHPANAGDLANVRITMPMPNATPDLLWMTGFSVQHRHLTVDAPMVREHNAVLSRQTDSNSLTSR
jgi:hypothetical protein